MTGLGRHPHRPIELRMADVDAYLLAKARVTTPADPDIRACWYMVVRGLEVGWLDAEELRSLIEHLRDGRDFGVEELLFEHLGDRVRVSLLDDERRCAPATLLAQLEELARADGGR